MHWYDNLAQICWMSVLDYFLSYKISDDEDDTHPNVDTPSLFRWRHQARVDRMEQHEQEKDVLNKQKLRW